MENNIQQELKSLLERNTKKHQNIYSELPTVQFNPPWPSECLVEHYANIEKQHWQPVARSGQKLFANLEEGLGFELPQTIKLYYGSFWSNGICVDFESFDNNECYDLNLIQIWNEEDEENLMANMLGHCYARLKGRLPLSYFIGNTGNDVLSLCHETGNVLLEKPGKKAHAMLAPDLASFLTKCVPNLKSYDD